MDITEKVAYLKGLIEGMGIKSDTNEGKIYAAICDALASIALEVVDTQDAVDEIDEAVGAIDEDLGDLEDYVYGEDDDDDECNCDECDGMYKITCPSCGEELCVDEETLDKGSVNCPKCGELIEFDEEDDEPDGDEKK